MGIEQYSPRTGRILREDGTTVNEADLLGGILKNLGLMGITAKEPFSGNANTTHNFAAPMKCFVITNDGDADLTFTINGMTFTVAKGETFDEVFTPFTSVTVTTTVKFRAYARG